MNFNYFVVIIAAIISVASAWSQSCYTGTYWSNLFGYMLGTVDLNWIICLKPEFSVSGSVYNSNPNLASSPVQAKHSILVEVRFSS